MLRVLVLLSISGTLFGGCLVSGEGRRRAPVPLSREVLRNRPTEQDRLFFTAVRDTSLSFAPSIPPANLPLEIQASTYSSEYARRTLLPGMGLSLAAGDFDGDGQPDVYVLGPGTPGHLFHNDGKNRFTDVTRRAGVSGYTTGVSATFADYNRSGRLSLFIAGLGGVVVYRNNGNGRFTDQTSRLGLRTYPGEVYTQAVVTDLDGDAYPDLILTGYTDLNSPPQKNSFVFPIDFRGISTRIYHNVRGRAFTEITDATGIYTNPGRARAAIAEDFNGDGRPDLLILREEKPPVLYLNRGDNRFEDWTWNAGPQLTRNAFIGGNAADFDHDGSPDLALWSTLGNRVLTNCGDGRFEPAALQPITTPPAPLFGFRGTVTDLDSDGRPDVLAFDHDRSLKYFSNRSGYLQETPLTLFPSVPPAAVLLPSPPRFVPLVFGLESDGRITVWRRQPAATESAAQVQ